MHDPADADTPRCTACDNLLWDSELAAGRWACYRCEDQAAERLQAMPGMYARLCTTAALIKGTHPGGRTVAGYRVPPAPLVIPVLNMTSEGGAVTTLQAIEDDWRKALRWTMGAKRHHRDILGTTQFVTNNLPWACGNYPEIADDLETIRQLHADMRRLAGGEPPMIRITAYCDQPDCEGAMRITVSTWRATCPACGHRHDRASITSLRADYGTNPGRTETAA